MYSCLEDLRDRLVKTLVYKSENDGFYEQFIIIPKGLNPDVALEQFRTMIPEAYLDFNDMGDYFLERSWPTKEDVPEDCKHLIQE